MLATVGVTLTAGEVELVDKPLLKHTMQNCLPASDAVLEMIVVHLPSPPQACGEPVRGTPRRRGG